MPSDFSPDRFADKLATCTETTASIQSLSGWILFHRRAIAEMVDVWYSSFTTQKAAQQIVHFYIANDVMQTGMRKYGRDIPDAFSEKLLLAIAVTMSEGTQKTQEIVRKLVQVWRDRHVLSDQVIDTMSDMCSTVVKARKEALKDTMALAKQHAATTKTDDESVVLQDIPDAVDSELTRRTIQMIEELEGEVVSTDLLSDRMFQLSSNLNYFAQATTMSYEDDSATTDWGQLELPVFEIDLDASSKHVAAFRGHLENQLDKRTALTAHFKSLTTHAVLDDVALKEIAARMDSETEEMQALYDLCVEAAEAKEQKRREFEAAAALQRRHSHTDVSSNSSSSHHGHYLDHRRSDSDLPPPGHYPNHRPHHHGGDSSDAQYGRDPSFHHRDAYVGNDMDWRASARRSGRERSRSRSRSRSKQRSTSRHQDERRRSADRPSHSRDRPRQSRFHDQPPPDFQYDQGYPPQRNGWSDGADAKRPRQYY